MTRIAVLDDYQGVALECADWSHVDAEITVFRDHLSDLDALAERLRPFDAVCLMRERTPLRRELIDRLPALRFVSTTGGGNASVDLAALAERGIPMSGTGSSGQPTAELAWGLILSLLRHIPAESAAVRDGGWQSTIGRDLDGARLGIVGLGRLGSRVARIGAAFGCDVTAWSPHLTPERAHDGGARAVSKEELFAGSDIVTVHLVLGRSTRGLIGADELALMKPTSILVNTARGPLVDEEALVSALREGRIAGAGLDTFDVEPLPADHPFRTLPQVIATPHLGYVTERTYDAFFPQTVENLRAWLTGSPIRVVEPPRT
jgi:phosphoglycerate dehydrogenase-like enzyme